ncbi:hypothetical protein BRADI_1g58105v3 [Brachypodium distachyon]|uniref:Myb-like domain-containing protein n=1 Tax=Brachypodium distachyon TaxID=15368 RepID=A0A0Q3K975_BRADI|nr:hypothetical protein BRADI_1g58105v3 [Brachypodium distachyon]
MKSLHRQSKLPALAAILALAKVALVQKSRTTSDGWKRVTRSQLLLRRRSQGKKMPRGSHNLKKFCYVVTRHSDRGCPESPERAQKAFATTCGAVACKYCKITNEWSDISEVVRNMCIADVARRFQVTDEWRERFLASINIAGRNGLATWKCTARKWMDKPYEIIKKKWLSITDEAEWEKFKKESSDPAFIARSERMRALRARKPLNHRLGSAGKEGKKKVWCKQDRILEAAGRVPPVHNILEDNRAREYARQHMTPEEWAGIEPMQPPVKSFTENAHKWEESKRFETSADSVQSKRWESAVTAGLQKTELMGRVLGEGEGACWDDYFPPAPKRSRVPASAEIIEQAKAEAREQASMVCQEVSREYAVQDVHHLVSALAKDHPALDAILGGGVEGLRNR